MPRRNSDKPLPQAPRQRQQSSRQEQAEQKHAQHHISSSSSGGSNAYSYRESYHPPIHKQVVYFVRTVPGLERTLRLVQAVAQLVTEVASSQRQPRTAAKYASLQRHLALTRRYFRFFNFIDNFDRAYHLLVPRQRSDNESKVVRALDFGKFSALGIYVVLEDLTILHALNIHPVPWGASMQTEAYKFWFYGLSLSIAGGLWTLVSTAYARREIKGKGGSSNKPAKKRWSATALKRVVVDGCDLLIPGAFLGWFGLGDDAVGVAMIVSTVVSGRDIWRGINA